MWTKNQWNGKKNSRYENTRHWTDMTITPIARTENLLDGIWVNERIEYLIESRTDAHQPKKLVVRL